MNSGFDKGNEVGTNTGSRRRFWSLTGAIGFSYRVTVALIATRTAGL